MIAELSTLVKLEWKDHLSLLNTYERFEKQIKWILRILTFIDYDFVFPLDKIYNEISIKTRCFHQRRAYDGTFQNSHSLLRNDSIQ